MENLTEDLKNIGIYTWKWEKNIGIINTTLNTELINLINDILEKNQDNKEMEFNIDYLHKYYKLTITHKDNYSSKGFLQDITSIKKLTHYDSLTKLLNRLGLKEQMTSIDFNTTNVAVIFFDLDNFKKLNDIYGHDSGNKMLKSIAYSVSKILSNNSHFARVSGDEFVILIKNFISISELQKIADSILEAIIHANDEAIMDDATISASMGIAVSPDHGNTYNELISKADIAMYVAKKHGKAKYLFYDEEINSIYNDYTKVHENLVKAFKQKQFKLNFQAIYDLKNNNIFLLEIFPYWLHPKKGIIEYEEFLQTLYEEGLIFTFDEWMIEEAIKKIALYNQKGINIKISLNISPKHLALEHFHKYVEKTLNKYNVSGSNLYIEMVEFILKEDFQKVNYNFKKLQELGCKIIIDRFAINHSTFSVINIMNFDMIKIHRYFVETLNEEYSSEIILLTIYKLAKEHNKKFIVEGILNEKQLEIIQNIDCQYAQGSYFHKPQAIENIITYM